MITRVSLAILVAATPAFADDEPTAPETTGAPAPGAESGRADTIDESDSTGRVLARGVLFVPRAAIRIALAPVEGTAWVVERYQLVERGQRFFFNDAGTFGIVPTFAIESGFGLNVGAHMLHRDMFGARERFDLRASRGGRFDNRLVGELHSGNRFGRAKLELTGEYEHRPKDTFYGIGNGDEPQERFRQRIARVYGVSDVRVAGDFHVRAASSIADREVEQTDAIMPVDTRTSYNELELRWDSRGRAVDWEPMSLYSTGTLAAAFAGRSTALDNGVDFYRYGVDVQQFFRVGPGPRVISLRGHGEAVTGDLAEIPFIDLPRLGGDTLRGYARDRFRDRVATVASADYQWDLTDHFSASLFVDAGRVHESVTALETSDIRVGYGMSIEMHTTRSYLARATLASSKDGGVFFNFALDPVFELDGRVERR